MARTHELSIVLNDVALMRDTKHVVNGDRPGQLLMRGMWLSEITVAVEYEDDGAYSITAIQTDTEQRRPAETKWARSHNVMTLTGGPLFDMICASIAADHDGYVQDRIAQDIIDRADNADLDRADWLHEQRRGAAA